MGYLDLVDALVRRGTLKTPSIIEAFRLARRDDFLPEAQRSFAEKDHPLPIGAGQTNSQPTTVAIMLELLQPRPGDCVLDVGCGSGWTTALLAHIVGPNGFVIGVERIEDLVEMGRRHLEVKGLDRVTILQASSGVLGAPERGPYDRILVSAAAQHLEFSLVEQLKDGAVMVLPIQNRVERVTKKGDGLERERYEGFSFVPLIKD